MGTDADAIPSRLGSYEVVLPIAQGGMATVYLARASGVGGFDRYLAIKLTSSALKNDPEYAALLIEEAKLVAHLRHTNVVPVYDVGECSQGVFLVMEYIPGDSFAGLQRLAREAGAELPANVGLKIIIDALHGLHAAHEHTNEDGESLNLVHRDVSPQNILVGTDGIGRLTDFGIAKASSRRSNTEAGFVKGKLTYLAPEQASSATLDRRCDVWAAGVVAWELLAGQKLYQRTDPQTTDAARPDPPRVKTAAPHVSDALDEVIARALRVDRDTRTPTALDFARELTTAAIDSGMLADADAVAEAVVRLVGPELVERKELLADMRRQRDRRQVSAPDVRTMIGMAGPIPLKRPPLPTLPEVPEPADDGNSELRIAVDLARPAERGMLGLPDLPPPPESVDPEVFKSPVLLQTPREMEAPPMPESSSAAVVGPASVSSDRADSLPSIPGVRRSTGWRQTAEVIVQGPWTTTKISIVCGVAGTVIGFILVLYAVTGNNKAPKAGVAGSSSGAALVSAEPTGSVMEMPPDEPAAAKTAIQIRANAPIASVAVGMRNVDSIVPAPKIDVELEDSEQNHALKIKVTGTDGRVAIANAEPGATEIDVTFAPKATPRPTTTPTTKHPWSSKKR